MPARLSLALFAILAAAVASHAGDDVEKERRKMQGTWKVALAQVDGRNIPLEAFKKVDVVFQDDKIVFKDNGKTYDEIEFDLDPAAKPRTLDYHYVFGLKKGVRERGIYQWEAGQLTICMAQGKQKRPADFAGKQAAGVQLLKLKRVEP